MIVPSWWAGFRADILSALQVKLQLLHPDIVMQPSPAEIRKAVAGIMSSLHETSQPFVRWMDGTCLEAAPVAGMQPAQP